MASCFMCKGSLEEGFSNYMADIDNHFIIIKHVPCHRCTQCGEVFYNGTVVARIEEIIEDLKAVLTEIAVVDYVA